LEINFENYFRIYNNIGDNKEPTLYERLKKIHSQIHPLHLIYLFGFIISFYFGYTFVKDTDVPPTLLLLYVLGLVLIHSLIIRKLIVLHKHSFEKTFEIVKKIHTKNFKKENGSE
jgi:hypothetical protein